MPLCPRLRCCCWYHKGTNFQANHNDTNGDPLNIYVVADTTKVRIFKQITTYSYKDDFFSALLLIPQRYEFSSKSQPKTSPYLMIRGCCWYHKGTNFQANHNTIRYYHHRWKVVADTTKVRIFKQITTTFTKRLWFNWLLLIPQRYEFSSKSQQISWISQGRLCCCWYHKGTNFQANHNKIVYIFVRLMVVADTTKVRIFKQITTRLQAQTFDTMLLLIPQRYEFSSKSQRDASSSDIKKVVADTTKVRIFKQITTWGISFRLWVSLLLIPQRYEFSSKSQQGQSKTIAVDRCCWYHKGTNFQANHNALRPEATASVVVADTTKVRIFKQITTCHIYFI